MPQSENTKAAKSSVPSMESNDTQSTPSEAIQPPIPTQNTEPTEIKFAAFSSQLELPFYASLFKYKLDHGKLDDSARFVLGTYEPNLGPNSDDGSRMQILGNALTNNLYVARMASQHSRPLRLLKEIANMDATGSD